MFYVFDIIKKALGIYLPSALTHKEVPVVTRKELTKYPL